MSVTLKSLFAGLPKVERGRGSQVSTHPSQGVLLYTNGKAVIMRPSDPSSKNLTTVYTEHGKDTTIARYSPSGFYVASADTSGKVRIWDSVNEEHILKSEFIPVAGLVKDLQWDSESKRIGVGVQGSEKFGHVVTFDTGNSVGEIVGHSKTINSVDFKPSRPYRFVTASEDFSLALFEGPPFKFMKTMKQHSNFVNFVRYSPSGEFFASAGQDGKVFLFDGKTGDLVREIGGDGAKVKAHAGGIYGLSWSPDSKQILTSSGDKSSKIFNVETGECVSTCSFGKDVDDMALGCYWTKSGQQFVITLAGFIHTLDSANPGTVKHTLRGHSKPIASMITSTYGASGDGKHLIFSSSNDGNAMNRVCVWDADHASGAFCDVVNPQGGHTALVKALGLAGQGTVLVSVGQDNHARAINIATRSYIENCAVKLDSEPLCLSVRGDTAVVGCNNHVTVLSLQGQAESGFTMSKTTSIPCPTNVSCCGVAVHPSEQFMAIAFEDCSFGIFQIAGTTTFSTPVKTFKLQGKATALNFTEDGNFLAVSDEQRYNQVFSVSDATSVENVISGAWRMSQARVTCNAWSPNGRLLATASVDTGIIVYDRNNKSAFVTVRSAHPLEPVTHVAWLNDSTLVTAGMDCAIRIWNVSI